MYSSSAEDKSIAGVSYISIATRNGSIYEHGPEIWWESTALILQMQKKFPVRDATNVENNILTKSIALQKKWNYC